MVHAVTLLLIMMLFGRWASLIPMCSLAAVLVVVSYNMSEWRSFRALLSAPRSDVAVLLTTFVITVVFDLTLAVQVGVVLAAFLFMKRMADVTRIGKVTRELGEEPDGDRVAISKRKVPTGVEVYEVYGPFFFGAAEKVREVLNVIEMPPKVLILRMRHVPVIDATGLHALEEVFHNCRKVGTTLVLCSVHVQPLRALHRSKHLETLGEANVTANIDRALDRARQILGLPVELKTKTVSRAKQTGKHQNVSS
jgi:SulP family sulfate permease